MRFNFEFIIKEAESVYQPKIDPNAFKFEEISDDCLVHIASFLKLIDIVNLGKTSNRLRSFTEQIYRKSTHFSFGTNAGDSSVNKKNLPIILQEMGSYVHSIDWRGLTERHLEYLSEYCQNITTLKLKDPECNLQLPSIEKNKMFFKNIESLEIENAGFSDATMKTIIASLSKLKSLHLVRCLNIKGQFFSEWKDSKLENLKIAYCLSVSPSSILDFQRDNKLIKFSNDTFDSFVLCLSLPPGCLSEYTELDLVLNSSTDEKLDLLHITELKQLKKIHLTCRNLNTFYQINYEPTFFDYDKVFAALSQIDTLKSITVEKAIIDGNTIKCLGLIKNLEEITFKRVKNRVSIQLYSDLHVHLPKITKLTMKMENTTEEIDLKSICDMILSLVDLRYFSHSLMTWQLLNQILQVQLLREQPSIEIGVSKLLFYDPKKVCATLNLLIFFDEQLNIP